MALLTTYYINYDYGKMVDGQLVYAERPLKYNGKTYLNPSQSQYEQAGYKRVVTDSTTEVDSRQIVEEADRIVIYNNVVTVEMVRQQKLSENESYCASQSVKHFVYSDLELWIDQMERLSLQNIATSYHAQGVDAFISSYWGMKFQFTYDLVNYICSALWIYDNECNNVEDTHRVNINALTTKSELRAYDVTSGYPSNPIFTPNSEE